MLITLITFVVVLGLLVFVHEFGHFITAKKSGVKVEEFGFGFPPRMIGIKRGETLYSLNWIPLGGFVKIKGEQGEFAGDQDSFIHKKIWQRGIILSSGVFMNIILCVVLFGFGFMVGLPQAIDEDLSKKAIVRDPKIQIISILENSPAVAAEILAGDIILNIDGQKFVEINDIQNYLAKKQDQSIVIELERQGEILNKEIKIKELENIGRAGLGVVLVKSGLISYPWYLAFWQGALATYYWLKIILITFYHLIRDLIFTQRLSVDVSGPVGIAMITAQAAKMGFIYILQFTALLSLNLAIINFLPFPALDGGRVLFLIIEKVRGRAVSQKIETAIHNIGFVLLMLLVVMVTFRDFVKFEVVEKIKNLF